MPPFAARSSGLSCASVAKGPAALQRRQLPPAAAFLHWPVHLIHAHGHAERSMSEPARRRSSTSTAPVPSPFVTKREMELAAT
eukprot:6635790-Prymnesium_polylepis.1